MNKNIFILLLVLSNALLPLNTCFGMLMPGGSGGFPPNDPNKSFNKSSHNEDPDPNQNDSDQDDENKCCICYDSSKDDFYFFPGCNKKHLFHKGCWDKWFKEGGTTCPFCRKEISGTVIIFGEIGIQTYESTSKVYPYLNFYNRFTQTKIPNNIGPKLIRKNQKMTKVLVPKPGSIKFVPVCKEKAHNNQINISPARPLKIIKDKAPDWKETNSQPSDVLSSDSEDEKSE